MPSVEGGRVKPVGPVLPPRQPIIGGRARGKWPIQRPAGAAVLVGVKRGITHMAFIIFFSRSLSASQIGRGGSDQVTLPWSRSSTFAHVVTKAMPESGFTGDASNVAW